MSLLIHSDAVGHRQCFNLVVGDIESSHTEFLLEPADLASHDEAQSCVEIRERLIEEQKGGRLRQRPAQRYPLLLSAGEFSWLPLQQLTNAEQFCDALHFCLDVTGRDLLELQWVRDVLSDGHVRIERVRLEDHSEISIFGWQMRDRLSVEADTSRGRSVDTCNHQQCCRLPTSARAQKGDEFPARDIQGDIGDAVYVTP